MNDNIWETHTILFNKKLIQENKKKAERTLKKKNNNTNFKLDENGENFKHKKITKKICDLIKNGRMQKKLTQKQLANMLNVSQKIIVSYENGTTIPDNNILGKLEKHLNIKLRGKLKD